jgi:hypothetical protein
MSAPLARRLLRGVSETVETVGDMDMLLSDSIRGKRVEIAKSPWLLSKSHV